MSPKKIILLLSTMIFGLLVSCSDDDKNEDCISNQAAFVTSVDAPKTGTLNKTLNIEVSFQVNNGCGGFGDFIEKKDGNTRVIEVEAKYVGCICTDNLPIRTVNYEFITNKAGNHELKFKSSPTEFITINLTVN
ncbi:hypothetical protein [Gelidibacter maritimus]|uniref:Lipoprotein n=1 Tax=Gelidibacter maritimus TaxID=2761487 RepID=A0A7W2R327_9FLAO|nr:hypothetical protein [Gelidibacter maritimus]MBA6151570.1 hypothetical protein [Gelidibacter maritimus]